MAQQDDVDELRRLVLEEGIPVNTACALGFTPLHIAVYFENHAAMRALVKLGGNVSAKNVDGTTPLILAAMKEVLYPTIYLLDCGASLDERDHFGGTALLKATKHNTNSATLLLQRNADPRLVNNVGESPLYYAVQHKNPNLVQHLIDANVDVNLQTEKGRTALHMAVYKDNPFAVWQLCAAGADVHAVCMDGRTAVYVAVFLGHWDVLYALHESGANLHVVDAAGFSLLHTAVDRGHNDVLLYLIRNNVDMHTKCIEDGSTALHAAVKNRHSTAVSMLCEANADVNAQDGQGYTPLAFADGECRDILLAHNKPVQAMIARFSFECDATP